ncbi:MAG: hypothetical protein IJI37_07265 [Opitutales bacterium]|nr:hypothetical protein [Opitutales bacterium]
MNLTNEQTERVKSWVAGGAGIAEVQKRLKDEFSVVMTYMDVRFLIDDLGAELVREPDAPEAAPEAAVHPEAALSDIPEQASEASPEYPGEFPENEAEAPGDFQEPPAAEPAQGAASSVKVSMSPIQRPDCIVSGDVVFSDGSRAEWRIDRMGQLGLVPEKPGMNPPQEDILEFQRQLQSLLR